MVDRPILFSTPMVRALLDGRKTMTRRALKPQPIQDGDMWFWKDFAFVDAAFSVSSGQEIANSLRFAPGDRLWVKERFNVFAFSQDGEVSWPVKPLPSKAVFDDVNEKAYRGTWDIHYEASPINELWHDEKRWLAAMFCPRWASRLTLIVEGVKVEMLQEISADDAEREGVFRHIAEHSIDKCLRQERPETALKYFRGLWESINGPGSWDANPWVAAISFRVVKANIDAKEPRS